ncbi:MAG: hypothetical protein OSA98_06920, partial [Rubripirellula sp.]|nr:hypothetical protein [Rubripirellula sp.]
LFKTAQRMNYPFQTGFDCGPRSVETSVSRHYLLFKTAQRMNYPFQTGFDCDDRSLGIFRVAIS